MAVVAPKTEALRAAASSFRYNRSKMAVVAQLVEHRFVAPGVAGSIPVDRPDRSPKTDVRRQKEK